MGGVCQTAFVPPLKLQRHAVGGPKDVIGYLGRYTHRTAISNDRILEVTDSTVTFKWTDYRNDNKKQVIPLKMLEYYADVIIKRLLERSEQKAHFIIQSV